MPTTELDTEALTALAERYAAGERAVGRLPGGGVARLEPEVPFLFVYRQPGQEDQGTARLLGGEASVLLAGPESAEAERLIGRVAAAGARRFGAFLVLELWAGRSRERFLVRAPEKEGSSTATALQAALRDGFPDQEVLLERGEERAPAGREPLLTIRELHEQGTLLLGLAVPPTYRSADGEETYPVYLRVVRDRLSAALRRAAFDFVRVQAAADVASYRALGPRVLDQEAVAADRELAEIEKEFSLLLLVSPVDQDEARERFQVSGCERNPDFHYRLLPFDPDLLKRRLFAVPLERVEDPALSFLLRDKREELDRQISLLAERNTPAFRPGSIRLYGTVDDDLVARAEDLLAAIVGTGDDTGTAGATEAAGGGGRYVDAHAFAARAREEFEYYRKASSAFESSVQVRPDLVGLMVSAGKLLVGDRLSLSADRVDPLIHHEVGTHVLTWCNGAAQPLAQLRTGLADYDELQEGLGVFAEYLVGGLSRARMRVLGARVLAAAAVQSGASFVETYRLLHREHDFSASGAFGIAARVHACGGFTRDAVYLRGLVSLLKYLEEGGELEPLYVGKLALRHVPVLAELTERGILSAPPIRPRFLDFPDAAERLQAARGGPSLSSLIS
ncbi:MAG: tyrosine/phenylalanine carboxypeptidase domain-containing protein [Gemmatimonadota bacterium]